MNATAPSKSWFGRLKDGITQVFTHRKLDALTLDELEELLILADLGPATAMKLTKDLSKERFGKDIAPEEVRGFLADEITKILTPIAHPLILENAATPQIVLMVGVNGAGKTTTIAKLAAKWKGEGKKVMIAACDTFRAAAVEQMKVWADRIQVPIVTGRENADAAGLAFDALTRAKAEGVDVLLIDTAGRLQNKTGLMEELAKIIRVLQKIDPQAPHHTLLTLDGTVGQNAHSQVQIFKEMVKVTGLILTKMDGSAQGGVIVALATSFSLPLHAICTGEKVGDIKDFDPKTFAQRLVGLEHD